MTVEEKLENLLKPTIESMGFEFWGCEYLPAGRHSVLRIYVEKPDEGINVDDCADISRQISAIMDVEDPISTAYMLEVSSPGMERLLFNLEQYRRYEGKTVQIRTAISVLGRRRFKGPMLKVTESHIEIEVDGELFEIPFDVIDKANLVAEF
ncbi:ribosome maturation factor RimP [Thiomicrorhabdus aquaedulcis]|uniref:ribosome maturation factor RimP n=1 Tax=Thiomicrorhabdus aquaedulcis TaxID=2211106 RepID=UPI000FD959DB|nr:ribosome maturation factor RimP [Thiomicrorhabdus aquaedulcis]